MPMSIRAEVQSWDKGQFSRMKFWRREDHADEGTTMKYTGRDFKQTGVLDVESRLGQGGMGYVWLARDKEDGTAVAVKVGKEVRM